MLETYKDNQAFQLFDRTGDCLEIHQNGSILLAVEHISSWFVPNIQQIIELRDWLTDYVIDRQNDCDHLNRRPDPEATDPCFSCADCGYGT